MQKILLECKLDGIDPPEYRLVGNTLSVTFTAPEDRVVRTGGRLEGAGTDSEDFGEAGKGGPAEATETREPMDSMESAESWPELAGIWESLSEDERGIASYLAEHGSSRPSGISRDLHMPERSFRRAVRKLADSGIVESSGQSRNRQYALKRRKKKLANG